MSTHASYFEVQVAMTEPQPVQVLGHHTLTTGRFTTTVNPLDETGLAYAPGQYTPGQTYNPSSSSKPHRAKKVEEDDYEDDPFMGKVVPIGENAELCFLLLVAAYFGLKIRKNRKKASL